MHYTGGAQARVLPKSASGLISFMNETKAARPKSGQPLQGQRVRSSPENSGECVALFADLGNTAVFSRRFDGVGKWNISKKSMLASSLAGCGKSALSVIPIEVRNLSGF
jgi:hypothetical protein